MSCQDYEIALGDYVDGTLDERSRIEVEAHLASCERCRAVVADFSVIRQAALSLEPELPPAHVWTKLSAAFEAERRSSFHGWGFSWQQSLAASARHDHARREPGLDRQGTGPRQQFVGTPRVGNDHERTDLGQSGIRPRRSAVHSAIAGLESITKSEQSALDMETADVLQANLTVIDGAITESRAALQTEPDNPAAQDSLFDALRSKLELLQDVVALINEMRKGNPEGAARIVSGFNQ